MCLPAISLQDYANLAQLIGVPFAVFALFYSGRQLRQTRLIELGRFMLELESMSDRHDRVHALLRPGGEWDNEVGEPQTVEDWCALEDYMGFFEHCELLLRAGTIEHDGFKALYGYRIENILRHSKIVKAKLIDERDSWSLFYSICRRFDYRIPDIQA
ncbi:MAG: hypothetical protein NUV63_01015 [Gallionella sp.]|nr:hypothetical protein [Gallionella sp.]